MKVKVYDYLQEDAMNIRRNVFMSEQGYKNEFDEIDERALHIVIYNNEKPVATCRIYREDNTYILGRIAVDKSYRGLHLGTVILAEAEKIVSQKGGTEIILHAQCRVRGFYENSGYEGYGPIGEDEGHPHIWMRKVINQ